jgi:hypothetical protein
MTHIFTSHSQSGSALLIHPLAGPQCTDYTLKEMSALGSLHIYRFAIYNALGRGRAVGKINIEFSRDDAERLFNLMARDEFEMFLFRRDANPKITTAFSAPAGAFFLPPRPLALGEKA